MRENIEEEEKEEEREGEDRQGFVSFHHTTALNSISLKYLRWPLLASPDHRS